MVKVQKLQNRVIDLERQLAEAQAAILAMTLPEGDRAQTDEGQEQERLLRESEARFSKALQAGPDALVIGRMNDGRITRGRVFFYRNPANR